jgi:energy-converting hydrogenase Eha subunit G
MLRASAILLTLWTGLSVVLSVGNLFWLLALRHNAPALIILFRDTQGSGIESRALATINALAVVCNAAIAAVSMLSLVTIWSAFVRGAAWAFWSLTFCLSFLQVFRWVSDTIFYHEKLLTNVASSLPLIAGIILGAIGLIRKPS